MVLTAGQLVKSTSATTLDTAGLMASVSNVGSYTAPTVTGTGADASVNAALATLNTNLNLVGTAFNALLASIHGIGAM